MAAFTAAGNTPLVYRVEIQDDEGNRSLIPVTRPEISIGRKDGNVIRLTDRNVSRDHATLLTDEEGLSIEDRSSYTGTHLNGKKVEGRMRLSHGDVVTIGDYQLRIIGEGKAAVLTAEDSQVTQIDAGLPTGLVAAPANAPLMEEEEDADPTAVITLRSGLGSASRESSHAGLIDGPPARLVVVSTNLAGTEIIVDRSPMRIGRGSECEATINHRSVSRHHASIEYRGDAFYVVDAGSANGITVNGERYAETPLRSGDRIDLGHVLVRFFPPGQIPEFADMVTVPPTGRGNPLVTISLVIIILAGIAGFFVLRGGGKSGGGQASTAAINPEVVERELLESIDNRVWSEASALLLQLDQAGMPLEKQEGYRKQIEAERQAETAIKNANAAEERDEWAVALQHLEDIPANSVYRDEAKRRMPSLEKKLVIQLLEQARSARDEGKLQSAVRFLETARAMEPNNAEVETLRQAIETQVREAEAEASPTVAARANSTTSKREKPKGPSASVPSTKRSNRRSTRSAKPSVKGMLKQANELLRSQSKGSAKRALPLLLKALKLKPGNPKVHRSLGIAYALLRQNAMARKHYKRYLQLDPNSPDAPALRRMLKGQ